LLGWISQSGRQPHRSLWTQRKVQRLNQDGLGQAFAQTESGVANLTEEVVGQAQHLDALLFAEPHLAQSSIHVGRGGQLLDDHRGAGAHAVQWAHGRRCAAIGSAMGNGASLGHRYRNYRPLWGAARNGIVGDLPSVVVRLHWGGRAVVRLKVRRWRCRGSRSRRRWSLGFRRPCWRCGRWCP